MSKQNPKEKFKSKIGGQALIEGVMMRGIDKIAMACRLPDGTIDVEQWSVKSIGKDAPWYKKTPLVRGCVTFVCSLIDGYKCLMKSTEKQGDFSEEELSKFEKYLVKTFGDKLMPIISVLSLVIGLIVCLGLFMFLPMFLTNLMSGFLTNQFLKTLVEAVIKISLFIGYLYFVSRSKDIARTFQYHGAEHKTIACYEAGEELIPENVKKFTRFHPRCGTSFLVIVLIVSILVFSVVTWDVMWLRVVLKLAFLPIVCGISYEIIRFAGNHDNGFTRAISAPGLALQRLTTKEPDTEMIECAIAALKPCIPVEKESGTW